MPTKPIATRQSLANRASELTGISKNDSELLVNAVVEAMRESVMRGEEIRLRGFGAFKLVRLPKAMIPVGSTPISRGKYKPGDWMEVAERTTVRFQVAKTLKPLVGKTG
jgi:nucleoid DNA-binding protein